GGRGEGVAAPDGTDTEPFTLELGLEANGRKTRMPTTTATIAMPTHVSGRVSHDAGPESRVAEPAPTVPRTRAAEPPEARRATSASYRRPRSGASRQCRAALTRFWTAVEPPRLRPP